ncbi:hypothetical protein [Kibdelosporangium aridum]|uniref:hypothetical protein n=1 Tax=Kibdelosporangium aridum TaxID=2030 RepID=UPI0005248CCA|nr:hypothetical protein [Kibdelosporangium aridum]
MGLVRDLIVASWQKRVTWRRIRPVVKALDARQGTVLRDRRYGGRLVAPGRGITSIRQCSEDEAVEHLLEAAAKAGYGEHQVIMNGRKRSLTFEPPDGLPFLWIEFFPAGTPIRGRGPTPVPDGHTGIVFSFG